jgi:hypothetical protein
VTDGHDASDVTDDLVADVTTRRDRWPTATVLDAERPPEEVRARAMGSSTGD